MHTWKAFVLGIVAAAGIMITVAATSAPKKGPYQISAVTHDGSDAAWVIDTHSGEVYYVNYGGAWRACGSPGKIK
jgi:hypothetical protein